MPRITNGVASAGVEFFRPVLDVLWTRFGPARLIYGSNWKVSERFAPLGRVEQIAQTHFAENGQNTDQVLWKNARIAYGLLS